MSYGLIAYNNSNQVLVSSDTRNLHFIAKVSSPTTMLINDSTYSIRVAAYDVVCDVTPVPFMTLPSTADFYGVTRITNQGGNVWRIEVVKSGPDNDYPEVYVFADPRGKTSTDAYGMKVFRDDGTAAFDSRLKPLTVTGGLAVVHPSNPKPSLSYGLSSDNCNSVGSAQAGSFAPDQYNAYSMSALSKPMFFFPSLAQAERQGTWSREDSSCIGGTLKGNCIGYYRQYNWSSTYWTFYRGGIRRANSTTLHAGWIQVAAGCTWTYSEDSALIGIGTGGSSGSGGSWPYSNETINLSAATVIIGDASRYD
jgi:hypothetical protein